MVNVCIQHIAEIESVNYSIKILSENLTKEQIEIINLKMKKFLVANRFLSTILVLNHIFKYLDSETPEEKDNAFKSLNIGNNSSEMTDELMRQAKVIIVDFNSVYMPIKKAIAWKLDDWTTEEARQILHIADKYLAI